MEVEEKQEEEQEEEEEEEKKEGKTTNAKFIEETHPQRPTITNPFHSYMNEYLFYQCYVFIYPCHPNKCAKLL